MGEGTSIGGGPLTGVPSTFQLAQVTRTFLGDLREVAEWFGEQLEAFEAFDVKPRRLADVQALLAELEALKKKTEELVDEIPVFAT